MAKTVKVGSTKFKGHQTCTRKPKQKRPQRSNRVVPEREVTLLAPESHKSVKTPARPPQPDRIEQFAENLRRNPTKSEQTLREYLVCKGYDFAFNEPLYGYIPDFYFAEHKLIVELDGWQFHDKTKDLQRDLFFKRKGIRTLRFPSHWVFKKLQKIVNDIQKALSGGTVRERKPKKRKRKGIINELIYRERPIAELDQQWLNAVDRDS